MTLEDTLLEAIEDSLRERFPHVDLAGIWAAASLIYQATDTEVEAHVHTLLGVADSRAMQSNGGE